MSKAAEPPCTDWFSDGVVETGTLIINGAMQVSQRGTSSTGIILVAITPLIDSDRLCNEDAGT